MIYNLYIKELTQQEILYENMQAKFGASLSQFSYKKLGSGLFYCILIFLKKSFQIRKTTANKFYEVLVTYDDIAPIENLDEIMTILSETIWYVVKSSSVFRI
jgi:hypothetical protein